MGGPSIDIVDRSSYCRNSVRDMDIRRSLRSLLESQHADDGSLIVDELGLLQGQTRVDMAVVNGELTGYEIKSGADTLLRLDRQEALYNEILDRVFLVATPAHLRAAQVPAWWGLVSVETDNAGLAALTPVRSAELNPRQNPLSIAQLLWRDETIALIHMRQPSAKIASKPRRVLWAMLVALYPLKELKDAVRETLKARPHWRVGDTRA